MEQRQIIITCTTCQARLTVRDESLIGQIVACPKCESMVYVTPPDDMASDEPVPEETPTTEPTKPVEPIPNSPEVQEPAVEADAGAEQASGPSKPSEEAVPASHPTKTGARWTRGVAAAPPPLPAQRPDASVPPPDGAPISVSTGLSPAEQIWRGGLLWGGLAVAAVVLIAGLLLLIPSSEQPSPTDQTASQANGSPSSKKPPETTGTKEPGDSGPAVELPSAGTLDPFWVPDGARMVVSVVPSRSLDRSGVNQMLEAAGPFWKAAFDRVLKAFSLRREELLRITWSTTDLGDLAANGIVVIEVEPECDLARLDEASQPTRGQFHGKPCRRLTENGWEEPFALTGPHTIVTGQAELLKTLGSRDEPRLASPSLAKMLKGLPRQADLTVLLDLEAARQAGWQLPEQVMNAWPPGVQSWQTLWRLPKGLGIDLSHGDGTTNARLDLVCDNESNTEKVLAAVERLVPTGKAALAEKIQNLAVGDEKQDQVKAYRALLQETVDALTTARWEQLDTTVRVTSNWGQDLLDLGLLALDSLESIRLDWKAAVKAIVEGQERRLVDGLDDYRRAKGYYPAAAVGGALLPPETRLSWIATLLPYYGHPDWAERLEPGWAWDAEENAPVTRRVLPEVVNPAFGPTTADDGFPVTHYVGSAGLGQQAARLGADNARAGVFGFGRKTLPSQITDGASNTIAVFGVCNDPGPWAAGGHATVRALTQRPYVNGPDGFGTGQANGMYVGMADGSVRFLSKDIDPQIIEHMVTINGGETPSAADQHADVPEPVDTDKPSAAKQPVAEAEKSEPTALDDAKEAEIPQEITKRLNRPLESVKFEEVELGDLIHTIREMSALPIEFDHKSLAKNKISLNTPVTIEQQKTTIGRLLTEALEQCELRFVVRNGTLIVTSAEDNGQE